MRNFNLSLKSATLFLTLYAGIFVASAYPATFTVSSNANAGANTLRQAIIDANASPGADIIEFNFAGPSTITLTACQQQITGPVTIDGYSNPGAGAGNLMIEVISPAGCYGFHLAAGSDGSIIRGIVISGGAVGIYLNGSDGHTITGNYIGTNRLGTALAAGLPQNGIHAFQSDNNAIGGTGGQIDRNMICGTLQAGIRLETSTDVVIINNYIGVDVNGNTGLGNTSHGIYGYNNSHNPRVGGTTLNERNIIASCGGHGIFFHTCNAPMIKGNVIGMGANGTEILGNGGSGINCEYCPSAQIGGLTPEERNYSSNNQSFGIVVRYSDNTVMEGNWLGVDMATGLLDYGNRDAAITVTNTADVRIGGSVAGAGNICSASGNPGGGADGISIWSNSPRPIIKGNIIGLGADGVTPLQNYGHGIECLTCDDGIIGGTTALERNYIAESFNRGIQLVNSPRVSVLGNYIGTDVSGNLDRGGSEMGIAVDQSADVIIGGNDPGEGNVISGNAWCGISVFSNSSGADIIGNIIGLGTDGSTVVPNGRNGIEVTADNSDNILIENNTISANGEDGINLNQPDNVIVIRNRIGTTAAGNGNRGNTSEGIRLASNSMNTIIGGSLANANTIAYNNGSAGVLLESVVQFGTITFNSIYCNAGPGIDLQGTSNESVLPPGITASGTNSISGTGTNGNIIHIYRNATGDGGVKCNCEGEIYIGSTVVAGGVWSFAHNLGLNAVQVTNVTATQTTINGSTSEFTNCTSPLPVDLLFFSAEKQVDHTVLLTWATASEKSNARFEIQFSTDGVRFETFAVIAGAGNSNAQINYQAVHANPVNGINYYRIKQVDMDGSTSYSDIRNIDFSADTLTIISSGDGITFITGNNGAGEEISYRIYSLKGTLLFKDKIQIEAGLSRINVRMNLAEAMYIVSAYDGKNLVREKIVIAK